MPENQMYSDFGRVNDPIVDVTCNHPAPEAGVIDTYTVTMQSGYQFQFQVRNGQNGLSDITFRDFTSWTSLNTWLQQYAKYALAMFYIRTNSLSSAEAPLVNTMDWWFNQLQNTYELTYKTTGADTVLADSNTTPTLSATEFVRVYIFDNTPAASYVPENRTIAGIDLQDDITKAELNAALTDDELDVTSENAVTNRAITGSLSKPAGVYDTLAALTSAYPSGNGNVYVVRADNKWYTWSGSAWVAGGDYKGLIDVVPTSRRICNLPLNKDITFTELCGKLMLNLAYSLPNSVAWEQGGLLYSDGTEFSDNGRIRTGYIPFGATYKMFVEMAHSMIGIYYIRVLRYNRNHGFVDMVNLEIKDEYAFSNAYSSAVYFRVVVARYDEADVSTSEGANVVIGNMIHGSSIAIKDPYTVYPAAYTDITEYLVAGKRVVLNKGSYLVRGCNMADYTSIEGQGEDTWIVKADDNPVNVGSYCDLRNFAFWGQESQNNNRPTTIGANCGFNVNSKKNVTIDSVRFRYFSNYALRIANTVNSNAFTVKISNCDIEYCYYGLFYDARAEFVQTVNVASCYCRYGAFVGGGNNIFSNCVFNQNYVGFKVQGGTGYSNNSHGQACGCMFNHNVSIAIEMSNVDFGYLINCFQAFYGKIYVGNSKGTIFTTGDMGDCNIEVSDGQYGLMRDITFDHVSPTITVTNNALFEIINGRLYDGTRVEYP